jgi:hypothetical protein
MYVIYDSIRTLPQEWKSIKPKIEYRGRGLFDVTAKGPHDALKSGPKKASGKIKNSCLDSQSSSR